MASSSSGDWTAGLIAILAALLIGAGLTAGAYFGLYVPKIDQRKAADDRLGVLQAEEAQASAALDRLRKLKAEADEVATRIENLEATFAQGDATEPDVPGVRDTVTKLCAKHRMDFHDIYKTQRNPKMVYPGGNRITFPHGLKASLVMIEVKGTFHDFGRFLADLESLDVQNDAPKAVIIPDSLYCMGDNNGKKLHQFTLLAYVVEKRDVKAIGS